jgi:hypothetical protein
VEATVTVLNGTTKEGFARDISGALQRIGFDVTEPDTTDPAATTTVQHAPGQANYGRLVASYLTTPATLVETSELGDGEVVVVAGADFTTVHDRPAPTDETTTTTDAGQPAANGSTTDADTSDTTEADTSSTTAADAGDTSGTTAADDGGTTAASSPTTATTEANPFIIGEPPRGETCD